MSDVQRLTREQAAIVGLFTGIACGPFEDIHELAEKVMGCSIWTHQFADKDLWKAMKDKVKPQFVALCAEKDPRA